MKAMINLLGTASGLLGVIICGSSGLARLTGSYYLAQYEITSLFIAGTGLMVLACLLKLELLLRKGD